MGVGLNDPLQFQIVLTDEGDYLVSAYMTCRTLRIVEIEYAIHHRTGIRAGISHDIGECVALPI